METEGATRPSAADLIEHIKDGQTLRQIAARYGRSTKQIKRWFKANDLDWRTERRTEDAWTELLAGARFEDFERKRA